jgi:hypothetical protein
MWHIHKTKHYIWHSHNTKHNMWHNHNTKHYIWHSHNTKHNIWRSHNTKQYIWHSHNTKHYIWHSHNTKQYAIASRSTKYAAKLIHGGIQVTVIYTGTPPTRAVARGIRYVICNSSLKFHNKLQNKRGKIYIFYIIFVDNYQYTITQRFILTSCTSNLTI